jgi:hypothetical protein
MRRLLVLVTLAACSDPPIDSGPDGALSITCDPPATEPASAEGDGAAPSGTFQVAWTCVSGCDADARPVIAHGNGLSITVETRSNGQRMGTLRWSVDGEPLYPITMPEIDGCWAQETSATGCHSSFAVCDRLGRATVAHLAMRDYATGAEQVWRMD